MKPYFSTLFIILFLVTALHQQGVSQSGTSKPKATAQTQQKKPAEKSKATAQSQSSAAKSSAKPATNKVQPVLMGNIDRGLDFLKKKEVASAVEAFQTAKGTASKTDKKTCRKLIRTARKYDYIYFRKLKDVEKLRQKGDYVVALKKLEKLRVNFFNIKRRRISNRLSPVDSYLMQQHQKIADEINKDRVRTIEKMVAEAQKQMSKNPARAKEIMAGAKPLMNPEEIKKYYDIINAEADYNINLNQGNEAIAKKNYSDGLKFYEEAQKKQNTPDIRNKITATRLVIYNQYLKDGDASYAAGRYVKAADYYKWAEYYTDNYSELNTRKEKVFPKLVEEGKSQARLGMHKSAVEIYDLALRMGKSDEVKILREESYNFVQYDEWMEYAHKMLRTGDTYETKKAILSAQEFRKTDVDREMLAKMNAFHKYCKDAEDWLRSGDIDNAKRYVAAAFGEVRNGNWAINLDTKIKSYDTNIKNAEDYLSTDLAKAKGCIETAGQICNTQKVKELRKKAGM